MKKNLIEFNLASFKFLIEILPKNALYFVFHHQRPGSKIGHKKFTSTG